MNPPWSTACQTLVPIGMPDGGAHPSLNQKTYRSTYPSQNTGIETPRSEHHPGSVGRGAPSPGRQEAGGDADQEPRDRGAEGERDRDREAGEDLLLHRDEVAVRVVD